VGSLTRPVLNSCLMSGQVDPCFSVGRVGLGWLSFKSKIMAMSCGLLQVKNYSMYTPVALVESVGPYLVKGN
jgi:hypothetical protein